MASRLGLNAPPARHLQLYRALWVWVLIKVPILVLFFIRLSILIISPVSFWLLGPEGWARGTFYLSFGCSIRRRKTVQRSQYLELIKFLLHFKPRLPCGFSLQRRLPLQHVITNDTPQTGEFNRSYTGFPGYNFLFKFLILLANDEL